jgi:hypothetical protein
MTGKEPIINDMMGLIISFRPLMVIYMAIDLLIIFEHCLVTISFINHRNHFDKTFP